MTTVTVVVSDEGERGSRTALAGFLFAGLFTLGWVLLRGRPTMSARDEEIVRFFTSPSLRRAPMIAGLYVVPIAAVMFLWFMAALRDRIVRAGGREHLVLSTVHLIAGTLFAISLFVLGAVEVATVWLVEHGPPGAVDVDAARAMIALGTATGQIIALRTGAVFVAISTTRGMRSGLFPRWFGAFGLVAALALLLAVTTWPVIVLLVPLWVVGASSIVLTRHRNNDLPSGA